MYKRNEFNYNVNVVLLSNSSHFMQYLSFDKIYIRVYIYIHTNLRRIAQDNWLNNRIVEWSIRRSSRITRWATRKYRKYHCIISLQKLLLEYKFRKEKADININRVSRFPPSKLNRLHVHETRSDTLWNAACCLENKTKRWQCGATLSINLTVHVYTYIHTYTYKLKNI